MEEIIQRLLRGPRRTRVGIYVVIDAILAVSAVWLAFALRLEDRSAEFLVSMPWIYPIAVLATIESFRVFRLYRSPLRFATGAILYRVAMAGTIAAFIVIAAAVILHKSAVPGGALMILWGLLIALPGAARMLIRDLVRHFSVVRLRTPVAIYGAGTPGYQLASALLRGSEFQPVALLDDAHEKQGQSVGGLTVHHPDYLRTLVETDRVKEVLVAIPSASRSRKKEVISLLSRHPVVVRIVPSVEEIAAGRKRIDDIRPVEIADLLGREPVSANESLLTNAVSGKSVMVTGAGGSIGAELCREIFKQKPSRLVLVERNEFALYSISRELEELRTSTGIDVGLVPELASVNDRRRMAHTMTRHETEIVFHAAAHKHVPIVELNASEGVRNNIFGTLHCALAAREAQVKTFVLVSTDKAVRPTNVMGATKRFAELILQALSEEVDTPKFSMVRFGNVLASSGSVVPLFKQQIERGGPVTVTHPEIARYFMTIPEAASLVIQAAAMSKGGDVFVLDMGEPVRITDLAERMIHLSGLRVLDESNPDGDIEIVCTGMRPGEKLHEELLIGDNVEPTHHPMIMRAREEKLSFVEVTRHLEKLRRAGDEHDVEKVRAILAQAVAGYRPDVLVDTSSGPRGQERLRLIRGGPDRNGVTDARQATASPRVAGELRDARRGGNRHVAPRIKDGIEEHVPAVRSVDAQPASQDKWIKGVLTPSVHKER